MKEDVFTSGSLQVVSNSKPKGTKNTTKTTWEVDIIPNKPRSHATHLKKNSLFLWILFVPEKVPGKFYLTPTVLLMCHEKSGLWWDIFRWRGWDYMGPFATFSWFFNMTPTQTMHMFCGKSLKMTIDVLLVWSPPKKKGNRMIPDLLVVVLVG